VTEAGPASRIILSDSAPDWWEKRCVQDINLFHSEDWASVLRKGSRVDITYAWDPLTKNGAMVPVFRAGPFRIGYAGFPVGGMLDGALDQSVIMALRKADHALGPHLIRYSPSAFEQYQTPGRPAAITPETIIMDLSVWEERKLPGSVRRNVRKAMRSGLKIIEADPEQHAESIYSMYADTVIRHAGNPKYSKAHFYELLSLAANSLNVQGLVAVKGSELAGFIIIGGHKNTAYYLHGAYNPVHRGLRPSDLLFYEAILRAKTEEFARFNFMASPPNQPSLVLFKEKWGGVTGSLCTYDYKISVMPANLFVAANAILNRLPGNIRVRLNRFL